MGKGIIKKKVHGLVRSFLNGDIDKSTYKRQLRNLISEYTLYHVGISLTHLCIGFHDNIEHFKEVIKASIEAEPGLKKCFDDMCQWRNENHSMHPNLQPCSPQAWV